MKSPLSTLPQKEVKEDEKKKSALETNASPDIWTVTNTPDGL